MNKVVVLIGYKNEHIDFLFEEANQDPLAQMEEVVEKKNELCLMNHDEQIFKFYACDENGKIELNEYVMNKILNPGSEWEGTPYLEFEYDNEKYKVGCFHIDGY